MRGVLGLDWVCGGLVVPEAFVPQDGVGCVGCTFW
jgi:hypothetical protein